MYDFFVFDRSITFPFCRTDNGVGTKTLKNRIKKLCQSRNKYFVFKPNQTFFFPKK